jgi:glutamine amidotransferase
LARDSDDQVVDLSESGIMMAPTAQELALVASVPLTDEPWEPINEGEVIAVRDGLVWARLPASASLAETAGPKRSG